MKGGICIPVCATSANELVDRIHAVAETADIVEVRFDCLDAGEVFGAVDRLPEITPRYLFTFRPKEQGGRRNISINERISFWTEVLRREGDFLIDIEGDAPELLSLASGWSEKIVSLHDFTTIWERPLETFDELAKAGGIVKMAGMVEDAHEAAALWPILNAAGPDAIPVAMGEAGKWTRILALAHGAFLTFASDSPEAETAPGQITAHELKSLYNAHQLSERTKVFGIIGNPVSQSLSRFMHNPAFRSIGFDGVFIPFLVKDIDEFMRRMVRPETREIELNFGGFSVTMPHKQGIIRHLDQLDPTAEKIGAVNTVKIENGRLIGYNTDAHGFISPLKHLYGKLRDARVAVFGAGGASRACIFALQQEGAAVEVFVRNPQKAGPLGNEFGLEVNPMGDFTARDFDILVNATPVGMAGGSVGERLFTRHELEGVTFVYDLVTKPYDTPIITEARAAGAGAIGGVEMLIAQGVKQFELWTGADAPVDEMREAIIRRFADLTR